MSLAPKEKNLTVVQGSLNAFEFTVTGTPDLVGYFARMRVRVDGGDRREVWFGDSADNDGKVVILDPHEPIINVTMHPASTDDFPRDLTTIYRYDLEIYTNSDNIFREFEGRVVLRPQVTD